jgi:hypothetical protein
MVATARRTQVPVLLGQGTELRWPGTGIVTGQAMAR